MSNSEYRFNKLLDNSFFEEFGNSLRGGKIFPPMVVAWDCSRKCNLHCIHCGAAKESYDRELTTRQVKNLIDQLAEMKVRFFGATGGEPLLRKDLLEVMGYASRKNIATGFATNGYFIDRDVAGKIKEAGISSVQISIDGTEKVHNRIRGSGSSFRKAANAVKLLQEQKLEIVSVATTLTHLNFSELGELKELLLALEVEFWRICVVMPIGRADKNRMMLKPEQLRSLFEFVASCKDGMNVQIGENLPFLAEYEEKIRKAPLVCPIGFTACCVGVDGNVRGCPEMPDTEEFREGSILKRPFSEIWKDGFRKYRERQATKKDKECLVCKSKENCFGGCWVMREGNVHCIHDLLETK